MNDQAKLLQGVGLPVKDDGTAPDLIVEGFDGVLVGEQTIRLNLTNIVYNSEEQKPYREVVARLIMGTVTFERFVGALQQIIKDGKLK